MPTSPTAEYDVENLPCEENDPDSQELWESCIGWDDDEFLAALTGYKSAPEDDALEDGETAGDADENPFWDGPRVPSASKTLRTAASDPGPSKVYAALSRDSSTGEVSVVPNSSQAYAVFPEYNQEDIAEADRVERDLIHEDSVEPEGPPPTQAVSDTTISTSSRASRASIASFNSLQDQCSEVKLGKRRAREDDESGPLSKHSKADDGAPRFNLRTSKSDPGPSRAGKGKSTVEHEHEPDGFAFIAHNTQVQQLFDELGIAWGVQYELARGVTNELWHWEDMTRKRLEKLRGTNAESASRVFAVMLGAGVSSANEALWQELDREQAAILENESRGLGVVPGTWMGKPHWYGGQIQQIVRLRQDSTSKKYQFDLYKMQMTRSHRFARYLGSRRILQINIASAKFVGPYLKEFLSRKLVLCGRVYLTFAVKDGKVYAVEVDDNYSRTPRTEEGDQYRCSLAELVQWFNPLDLNANQPVSKWATRFDLGLSTSIPVIIFDYEYVHIIDDEYAPHPPGSKPPPEKIYTDGCGFMNAAALKAIQQALNLPVLPNAVQGRVFGSKGLWVLAPWAEHQSLIGTASPQIWIRKSQQKIKLVANHEASGLCDLHKAHFIFDLVSVSRVTTNVHLSKHTLVNLHHNGVPVKTLKTLMEDSVRREMEPLSQIDGPLAMQRLFHAVDNAAHVSLARLQPYAAGAQRVLGLASRWESDKDDGVGGETVDGAQSSPYPTTARYYPGGKPTSIAEGLMRLLAAGFTLAEDYLYDQLEKVKMGVLDNLREKMRFPLHGAAEALLVPDPTGKLRQGQIHFKSSSAFVDPPNEYEPRQITGSCLVYRNPARLPSDVLKVTAVSIPELSIYTNVIIVPNDGPCSLPSILAGGDVDGDTAICIWERSLVEPFCNPEIVRMPDDFLDKNFEAAGTIMTVKELSDELFAAADHSVTLQRHLLAGLVQSKVGIYSGFHDVAMYTHGYADERTLRIAHMFNVILDSRKSGHVVKPAVYERDSRAYNKLLPNSLNSDHLLVGGNMPANADRDKSLGHFVLTSLVSAIEKQCKEFTKASASSLEARQRNRRGNNGTDTDILEAWNRIARLSTFAEEIPVVQEFVDAQLALWNAFWQHQSSSKGTSSKMKQRDEKAKQDAQLRKLCMNFNAGPPANKTRHLREHGDLDTALAAYAYCRRPRFGFGVAFTQLALIKAKANGLSPIIESFGDFLKIPGSSARVLSQYAEPTEWA